MNEKIKTSLHHIWYDPKGRAKLALLYGAPLFWIVLVLKIFASGLFASLFLSHLFVPFLETFVAHPLSDPYAAFITTGKPEAFPYPAMMLYIMAIPRYLAGLFLSDTPSDNLLYFLYRLPLLIADLGIISILVRWSRDKAHNILWLYWASPVLFYITYMHGQLDVVPIALLFVALYALFKERFICAAIALGFGLATKTNLVISLPFFLIYLWRQQEGTRPALIFAVLTALAFLAPNLPFLGSGAFYEMVFHNAAQKKIGFATLSFSPDADYYLILGVYLLLVFKSFQITVQNRDLFLMFLGFSFGALLLFVAPMQGWYYWIIPFFAYFFARSAGRQSFLLWGLQATYLLYFLVTQTSDYRSVFAPMASTFAQGPNLYQVLAAHGLNGQLLTNIAYTLLQTALVVTCAWVYRRGVRGYQKHKLTSRSFLVGISGDSGSGKTTLADALADLFTERNITIICGDDMHKWQRGHQKWREMTHLDPRANELHQELEYITALRNLRSVRRRHYDHTTGQFTEELPIKPRPVLVFEGLHSFYLKPARDMMDLKIFVRPDNDLLLHHKIVRDREKRGYDKEKILESIALRKDDADKYIKVQERSADLVIAFRLRDKIEHLGEPNQTPLLALEIIASNSFYFDPLIAALGQYLGQDLSHAYDTEDRQTIRFNRPVPFDLLDLTAENLVPGLQELGVYAPKWQDGFGGIIQLFVAWCIFADSRRSQLGT